VVIGKCVAESNAMANVDLSIFRYPKDREKEKEN
jgi:hypothetical protein